MAFHDLLQNQKAVAQVQEILGGLSPEDGANDVTIFLEQIIVRIRQMRIDEAQLQNQLQTMRMKYSATLAENVTLRDNINQLKVTIAKIEAERAKFHEIAHDLTERQKTLPGRIIRLYLAFRKLTFTKVLTLLTRSFKRR
jgi:hypothetical protein